MKLIKISAIWCPACLIMRSRMEEIKKLFPDIEQIEYDYDFDDAMITKYNIGKILPVFILMDGDIEVKRIIGEKSLDFIIKELKGCLK